MAAWGAALGFKLEDFLRGAGGENVLNKVLNAGHWSGLVQGRFGVPGMVAPYGDDRVDQYWVLRGYNYYVRNASELSKYLAGQR